MSRFLILIIIVFAALSCVRSDESERMKELQLKVDFLEHEIEHLAHNGHDHDEEATLVHLVLLDLKEEADIQEAKKILLELVHIEQIAQLDIGTFEDLNDERALSEHELILETRFANVQQYAIYAKHPIHLAARERLKPMLAKPPVTYDYLR